MKFQKTLTIDFDEIVNLLYNKRATDSCPFYEFKCFARKFLDVDSCTKIIHVAGTNGKGSVCAMLESVYRLAGYRTGLFTSPHLIDIRERIQINRCYISRYDFCRLYKNVEIQSNSAGIHLSYFQYLTLIALLYFQESKLDVIILECGIGGRLDSTNIINADAYAITSIALDHEDVLGKSIEKIAYEKVSIVKEHSRIFVGDLPTAAMKIIKQYCLCKHVCIVYSHGQIKTNLLGDFQKKNSALAYSILHGLLDILPIFEDVIKNGLMHVFWPARNQKIVLRNGNVIIFDGGHNQEAAYIQKQYIENEFDRHDSCLIFSSTKLGHCEACLNVFLPYFAEVIITNISNKYKKLDDNFLKSIASKYINKCQFYPIRDVANSLCKKSLRKIFITGSLYFIGELARYLIQAKQLEEKCFSYPSRNNLST